MDLFYYSTTHAMLSLCKKLAAEGRIVRQDDLTDKRQEVRTIIEIILNWIFSKYIVFRKKNDTSSLDDEK